MKFGRVLAGAALAVVLVTSLFSGWLGSSVPKASAANPDLIINGVQDNYDLVIDNTGNGAVEGRTITINLTGATSNTMTLKIGVTENNITGFTLTPTTLTFKSIEVNDGAKKTVSFTASNPKVDQQAKLTFSGSGITTKVANIHVRNKTDIANGGAGGTADGTATGEVGTGGAGGATGAAGTDTATGVVTGTAPTGGGGNKCSITDIVGHLNQGIGDVIVTIIGCAVGGIAQSVIGPLEDLLKQLTELSAVPPTFFVGHAYAQNKVQRFESALTDPKSVVRSVWDVSMGMVDVIVILALLAIAFANILHININTYTAKKALPGLVIGVVMANASILIIRFLADVAKALAVWATDIGGSTLFPGTTGLITHFLAVLGSAAGAPIAAAGVAGIIGVFFISLSGVGFLVLIVAAIALLYYLFLVVAFCFSLIKRIILLYFLVMVAPLAFVAYGVPGFQQYFTKWWDNFLRYLFLYPIILFGISATILIANAIGFGVVGMGAKINVFSPTGLMSMILVFAAATYVLKLPGLVTKGTISAIDTMAGFKKTLSQAPRIAAGIQGGHKYVFGGGHASLMAKAAKMRNDRTGQDKWEKRALAARKIYNQKEVKEIRDPITGAVIRAGVAQSGANKWAKGLGSFRGYSTLFGNPEMLQEAFKERTDAAKKADIIAAFTTGGTKAVLNTAKGPPGAFNAAKGFAEKALINASTADDFEAWWDPDTEAVYRAIMKAARVKMDAEPDSVKKLEILQKILSKFRNATNDEKIRKAADEEDIEIDLSGETSGNVNELFIKLQRAANQVRLPPSYTGTGLGRITEQQKQVFPKDDSATPAAYFFGAAAPIGASNPTLQPGNPAGGGAPVPPQPPTQAPLPGGPGNQPANPTSPDTNPVPSTGQESDKPIDFNDVGLGRGFGFGIDPLQNPIEPTASAVAGAPTTVLTQPEAAAEPARSTASEVAAAVATPVEPAISPSIATSPPAVVHANEAVDQAARLSADAAEIFKGDFANLTERWRDAIESLKVTNVTGDPAQISAIQATLAQIHSDSLGALNTVMTADGQRIVDDLASIGGEAGQDKVRQAVENISAAMDMGINESNAADESLQSRLRQRVEAEHNFSTEVEAVNQSAVNQFDEAKLTELMGQSNEVLVNQLAEKLNPLVERLGQATGRAADPAFQKQIIQSQEQLAQKLATELRQAINAPGPKSLKGVIQKSFANFGSQIAKQWGLHQVSTGSIASAVAAQAIPQSPVPAPTVTVETTTVTPPAPSAPPIPPTPFRAETNFSNPNEPLPPTTLPPTEPPTGSV